MNSRTLAAALLLLLPGGLLAASAGEEDYAAGMKAAAAKDYAAALPRLEAAVTADPDSLRYASDYRETVIAGHAYDRCLAFFEKLVAAHPQSAAAVLNHGYAYVDKIPAAGSITQVILANTALGLFTRSIELKRTWLALYTRGNSYLYWPKIFGRTPLGVADLEEAVAMSKGVEKRSYHVRAYIALGEAYWKLDDLAKARATWSAALQLFPDNPVLKTLLAKEGDDLKDFIESELDPNKRVDTDLREVWSQP
ncbi:MAG TPA: tetratricopeptide repeat protein [Thermoanaerobaculia bacterium]|nr:tetratricopeptide repeat protein [Thermoanaerobaculia bacterium]